MLCLQRLLCGVCVCVVAQVEQSNVVVVVAVVALDKAWLQGYHRVQPLLKERGKQLYPFPCVY